MEPRVIILALLAVGASIIIGIWRAPATSPLPIEPPMLVCEPTPLSEQVAAADAIVVGQVVVVLQGQVDGLADVYVHPTEVYKGVPEGNTLRLVARTSAGRSGSFSNSPADLHFTSSDPPYLLFLKQRSDGRFDTSACDGSRRLGQGLTEEETTLLNVAE